MDSPATKTKEQLLTKDELSDHKSGVSPRNIFLDSPTTKTKEQLSTKDESDSNNKGTYKNLQPFGAPITQNIPESTNDKETNAYTEQKNEQTINIQHFDAGWQKVGKGISDAQKASKDQ